jgi:hypothetical protein
MMNYGKLLDVISAMLMDIIGFKLIYVDQAT